LLTTSHPEVLLYWTRGKKTAQRQRKLVVNPEKSEV
jgi:hypothetical protein